MSKKEIDIQEDDLTRFCNNFKEIFIFPDKICQNYVQTIINHPNFDKWGRSEAHQADPFVVGIAKRYNLTVISYENPRETKNTIPAACRYLNIPHKNFIEFLREEKFKMENNSILPNS